MSNDNGMHEQAQTAARIESYYEDLVKAGTKQSGSDAPRTCPLDTSNGQITYTVLDTGTFYRSTEKDDCCVKAIVVKDENGNIFVHFNGTGHGNWEYNADNAYGTKELSQQHQWAANYLDYVLEKYPDAQVYVTGHSQGGNLAQYASMATKHADQVKNVVSLDGPNMSDIEVEHLRQTLGEEEFNRRVDKMYAYNGKSDYVSILGQNKIIPDDHTYIVETGDEGYHAGKVGKDPGNLYHACNYMLDKDGNLQKVVPYGSDGKDESDFRKFARNLIERVKGLPPEEQNKAGHILMKIVDNLIGNGKVNNKYLDITPEELEYLKERLIPMIAQTIAEDPELAKRAIEEFLKSWGVAPQVAALIIAALDGFSDLPEERQIELLETIGKVLTVKDNKVGIDLTNLLGNGDLAKIAYDALLIIVNAAMNHPEDLVKIVTLYIADIIDYAKAHPLEAVALTLITIFYMPVIMEILKAAVIATLVAIAIDALVAVFSAVGKLFIDLVHYVLDCVVTALRKFAEWLNSLFNPGAAFSQDNPSLRIDTGKFHELAGRVAAVNRRVSQLDNDLNSLYWQVGLLDVMAVLKANLLVTWSPTLRCVQDYLSNTASAFESADRQVQNMFG